MTDAPRDGNNVPALLACLNTDDVQGQTLVPLEVTTAGFIRINHGAVVNFTMIPVDPKDENYVNCWLFKGTDGEVYPAVADITGALLIDNV